MARRRGARANRGAAPPVSAAGRGGGNGKDG
ncbi:hypothetical protein BPC006_II0362 [Burkholderia pseudomallei BPC006]|nr:hypothetical protein BPC006_II0362 [Burkholderia pseudomallei BPC006]